MFLRYNLKVSVPLFLLICFFTNCSSSETGKTLISNADAGTSPQSTTCDDDFSLATTETDISAGLQDHTEPSGALWHTGRDSLFVVDGQGYLLEMESDGTPLNEWNPGNDLEGITVADTDSKFVYLGVERLSSNSHSAIIEYNIATGTTKRTFDLSTWLHPTIANQGLEALTFVPNDSSLEGGYFYAALQETGVVYVFELPLLSSSTTTTVTLITSFTPAPGWSDLSDMFYDETDDIIYAIYDGKDRMISMKKDGEVLASWSLPAEGQEGIALNRDDCQWFLADDETGDLWQYK